MFDIAAFGNNKAYNIVSVFACPHLVIHSKKMVIREKHYFCLVSCSSFVCFTCAHNHDLVILNACVTPQAFRIFNATADDGDAAEDDINRVALYSNVNGNVLQNQLKEVVPIVRAEVSLARVSSR